jgi:glutathione S-transferase
MTQKNLPDFELISFELCPYVQRSVITLKYKNINFKTTFIDFENPPAWFNQVSPLGKVPVLLIREKDGQDPVALFESAVVNEYLDEVTPPLLQLKDPLKKASERAWIEVAGEVIALIYTIMVSPDLKEVENSLDEIWSIFDRFEDVLPGGQYFRGDQFSLVDAAIAPAFQRLFLYKPVVEDPHWNQLPKTRLWANSLLKLPVVRDSLISDFNQKFATYVKKEGGVWSNQLSVS